jgi:hypothetical protein
MDKSTAVQGYREPEFNDVTFLSIQSYSEHPEVYAAAEMLFDNFRLGKKQVRNPKKYPRDAKKLIASLWLHDGLFKFTTKNCHFSKGKRKQVWLTNRVLDLFKCAINIGWVELVVKAVPPDVAKDGIGLAAIYTTTDLFKLQLTQLSNKDITLNPDLPCVVRKDKNKCVIEEDADFYETARYKKLQQMVAGHLSCLIKHEACWANGEPISQVELLLTRRFTVDFSHGGRFYCNFQNKPKAIRNSITIDGNAVGSLDITQCHPMLILRMYKGKQSEEGLFRSLNEDVYQVNGFEYLDRSIRKKMVNTLFNAKTEESAIRALRNTHWWIDGFTNEVEIETYKSKKRRHGEPIFKGEEEIKQFIEVFKFFHPDFADVIGTGIGLELQGFDGSVTNSVLFISNQVGLPIIPIHEEYLVAEDNKDALIEILRFAIRKTLKEKGQYGFVMAKWVDSKGNKSDVKIPLA